MRINESVVDVWLSYSLMGLGSVVLACFLSHEQVFERHFYAVAIISILLITLCLFLKYIGKIESIIWNKKLPAKIKLPISESFIFGFNYPLGFILFMIAILSTPLTANIWLICLCICTLWLMFIHHPHVWVKDSIDLQDRIHHPEKYKMTYEDGFFEYPNEWEGFIYQPDNQAQAIKVKWSDIQSVDAKSIDMFTHLEIQLYILSKKNILQISESTAGYLKFYQQLQDHLADFDSLKMLVYLSGEFPDSINVYKKT